MVGQDIANVQVGVRFSMAAQKYQKLPVLYFYLNL